MYRGRGRYLTGLGTEVGVEAEVGYLRNALQIRLRKSIISVPKQFA